MSKYAPAREDGLLPYRVRRWTAWDTAEGREGFVRIEWAENLASAKRAFGYTRELHTYVEVRRATPEDMP